VPSRLVDHPLDLKLKEIFSRFTEVETGYNFMVEDIKIIIVLRYAKFWT